MLVANPRKQKLLIQVKDSLGFADLTIGTGEVNYLILKNVCFSGQFVMMILGYIFTSLFHFIPNRVSLPHDLKEPSSLLGYIDYDHEHSFNTCSVAPILL